MAATTSTAVGRRSDGCELSDLVISAGPLGGSDLRPERHLGSSSSVTVREGPPVVGLRRGRLRHCRGSKAGEELAVRVSAKLGIGVLGSRRAAARKVAGSLVCRCRSPEGVASPIVV